MSDPELMIRIAESIGLEADAKYAEARSLLHDATQLYHAATAVAAQALFDMTETATAH